MERAQVSLAVSSLVQVCCDEHRNGDWEGRFYTRYKEEAIGFQNTGELLERLEQFYNWLGFPQASMANRSFQKLSGRGKLRKAVPAESNQNQQKGEKIIVVNEETMKKHQGDKATFVVRIQYRQNASWQGQVTWAEENKTVPFRSALELLKLIDSTAAEQEDSWDKGDE